MSTASYVEALGLAALGAVEGVASGNGTIRYLRPVDAAFDMREFRSMQRDKQESERPGTITTMASQEVFRQRLGTTERALGWCWKHRLCDREL